MKHTGFHRKRCSITIITLYRDPENIVMIDLIYLVKNESNKNN